MSKLLIIGSNCFFGNSFINYKNKRDSEFNEINEIYLSTRKPNLFKKNFKNKLKKNFKIINNNQITKILLNDVDKILYLINSGQSKYEKNFLIRLCKIIKFNKFKIHFIYMSSGAVYGPNEKIKKIKETKSLKSNKIFLGYKNIYSVKKIENENILKNYSSNLFRITILRGFSFYGRYMDYDKFAIGNFIKSIYEKKPIILSKHNNTFRSFLFSDDMVSQILKIFKFCKNKYAIYNFGSSNIIKIADLAKKLSNRYKLPLVISGQYENTIDFYIPDLNKIQKVIPIKKEINLITGINRILKEINSN
ncbi:NAD-dependent epimerase/dehydratase family protein [Alphaproteobacteria bacterium]|nr:NAD-dependent epimerase/dehydratase family protein [Alphaproteobacteria bacterium]